MSYNIDHIENVSCDLRITYGKFLALMKKYEGELPEANFLHDLADTYSYLDTDDDSEDLEEALKTVLEIKNVAWCGGGSGRTRALLETILKKCDGTADLVLIWEGGDTVTGIKVRDGNITRCKVGYTLTEVI
jgi:hypothetical protein